MLRNSLFLVIIPMLHSRQHPQVSSVKLLGFFQQSWLWVSESSAESLFSNYSELKSSRDRKIVVYIIRDCYQLSKKGKEGKQKKLFYEWSWRKIINFCSCLKCHCTYKWVSPAFEKLKMQHRYYLTNGNPVPQNLWSFAILCFIWWCSLKFFKSFQISIQP